MIGQKKTYRTPVPRLATGQAKGDAVAEKMLERNPRRLPLPKKSSWNSYDYFIGNYALLLVADKAV